MPVNVGTDAINQLSPIDTCKTAGFKIYVTCGNYNRVFLLQSMQNVH